MGKTRKVTYSLPDEVVAGIREAVDRGDAGSGSALVRDAVTEYLARNRDARLKAAFEQAARDPDFQRDNDEVMRDFEQIDAEEIALWDER